MTHPFVWRNNEPTDYGITVYTQGDCWILAYYLAKQLQSDIGFVGARRWGHAVARVPGTQNYLDITGLNKKEDLFKHSNGYLWRGGSGIAHMTPPETFSAYLRALEAFTDPRQGGVIAQVPDGPFYAPGLRTARETAKRLIRKWL